MIEALEEKGWTLYEAAKRLAKELGISHAGAKSTLLRIKSGTITRPHVTTYVALARVFGKSLDYFRPAEAGTPLERRVAAVEAVVAAQLAEYERRHVDDAQDEQVGPEAEQSEP